MSKRKLPRRFSINKLEDIEGSYILNSPRLKKACKEIGVKFKEVFPIKYPNKYSPNYLFTLFLISIT